MATSPAVLDFIRTTTAVLVANLLTVTFVWAFWNLSRLDREGKQAGEGRGLYLGWIVTVGLFGMAGIYLIAATGR